MSRWTDVDAVARATFMTMQKPRQNMAQVVQGTGSVFFYKKRKAEKHAQHIFDDLSCIEESSGASSSLIKFS